MTSTFWHIGPDATTVAVDSSVWNSVAKQRAGKGAKAFPLVHLNCILAGGSWGAIIQGVAAEVSVTPVEDLADLRERLPDIIARHYRHFVDRQAPEHGIDLSEWSGAVFFLFTAHGSFMYGDEKDFAETPLPAGFWCDPYLDGSCRIAERFEGDAQLVRLMRRQRDQATAHIGGKVIRATIKRDGMSIATIGDLDATPQTAPGTGADPLTRQQRRNLARQQRKGKAS